MRSLYKRQLTMMVGVMVLSFTLLSTAFMLLCSGVEPAVELQGAPYVQSALAASFGTLVPFLSPWHGALCLHNSDRKPLLCGQCPGVSAGARALQAVHGGVPPDCHGT